MITTAPLFEDSALLSEESAILVMRIKALITDFIIETPSLLELSRTGVETLALYHPPSQLIGVCPKDWSWYGQKTLGVAYPLSGRRLA
jgi:hypothetical protein